MESEPAVVIRSLHEAYGDVGIVAPESGIVLELTVRETLELYSAAYESDLAA